ncbi:MAG TPA: hypothetical protein VF458_14380, partial [Ktedonobacteraceae bacterium]
CPDFAKSGMTHIGLLPSTIFGGTAFTPVAIFANLNGNVLIGRATRTGETIPTDHVALPSHYVWRKKERIQSAPFLPICYIHAILWQTWTSSIWQFITGQMRQI